MGVVTDEPLDPFAGDPDDPAAELARFDPEEDDAGSAALSAEEREEVLSDLVELDVFRALLEPRGTRGLVVDCEDCAEPHYFGWDLLMANLRSILEVGRTRDEHAARLLQERRHRVRQALHAARRQDRRPRELRNRHQQRQRCGQPPEREEVRRHRHLDRLRRAPCTRFGAPLAREQDRDPQLVGG